MNARFSLNSRGVILYLVLFVMLFLSLLSMVYFRTASQARFTAFRLELDELARHNAESAADEVFMKIWQETADAGSPVRKKFCELGSGESRFDFQAPVTLAHCIRARGYLEPYADVRIRLFDKRDRDFLGRRYYGGEGVGTLEISVHAGFRPSGDEKVAPVECHLIRHHDFKVMGIVTRSPREQACGSELLDYALLVGRGFDEFLDGNGFSVNHPRNRLTLVAQSQPPERRGKVFFGGTGNTRGAYLFLNTVSSHTGDVDSPRSDQFIPEPREYPLSRIFNGFECFQMFPVIETSLQKKKQEALDKYGDKPGATSKIDAEFQRIRNEFLKVQGRLRTYLVPVSGSASADLEAHRLWTLISLLEKGSPLQNNLDPGVDLLDTRVPGAFTQDYPSSILEGNLRQRFLRMILFQLDFTNVNLNELAGLKIESASLKKQYACVVPGGKYQAELDADDRFFYAVYEQLGGPMSGFVEDYPLRAGDSSQSPPTGLIYPSPTFRDRSGMTSHETPFLPFAHRNLVAMDLADPKELIWRGIWDSDKGILRLRGIYHLLGDLELGDGSDRKLFIEGQGVLVVDGEIKIRCGIEKRRPDQDCLALYSRGGKVTISTTAPVQAAIVSMNKDSRGVITSKSPLSLTGPLVVDRLNLNEWSAGHHLLSYDPVWKNPPGGDVQRIFLSRQVLFQRVVMIAGPDGGDS